MPASLARGQHRFRSLVTCLVGALVFASAGVASAQGNACNPDVTGPVVDVARPVVTFELANGYVHNRTRLATACEMTWVDACIDHSYLSGIVDIVVDSPDGEVMGGEPGYFQSAGLLADWHDIMLDLDRNQIGPRNYTITYRVLDAYWNVTDVECEVRVVDPTTPNDDCNGVDDDGDGEVDEDFVVEVTSCGVGACAAVGERACIGGAVVDTCAAGAPGDEICNDLDDDCDGETDEGYGTGGECSVGIGACASYGVMVCDGEGTRCDAPPAGDGGPELCANLIDDDCDGETDEGFDDIGTACAVGVGTCERNGVIVCDVSDRLGTVCSAEAAAPGPNEICANDADDDCDGETDEPDCADAGDACEPDVTGPVVNVGNPRVEVAIEDGTGPYHAFVQSACDISWLDACNPNGALTGIVDIRLEGDTDEVIGGGQGGWVSQYMFADWEGILLHRDSVAGARTYVVTYRVLDPLWNATDVECELAVGSAGPLVEICNDRDDDLDGLVDEDFDFTGACDPVGVGACQRPGVRVCTADGSGTECGGEPGAPAAEICGDGIDQDCDGIDQDCDEPDVFGEILSPADGTLIREPTPMYINIGGADLERWEIYRAMTVADLDDLEQLESVGFTSLDNGVGWGIVPEWIPTGLWYVGLRAYYRNADGALASVWVDVSSIQSPSCRPELCNGFDDNCNGVIDEGFDVDGDCTVGVGACGRPGVRACDPDNSARTVCIGEPGDPVEEVCGDGVDNNCDGVTDEAECTGDSDGDLIADFLDNCPDTPNPDQVDTDGDGEGDACDATPDGPDSDGDGIVDLADNCPDDANPNQEDADGDTIGDVCDDDPNGQGDSDGDGVADTDDNCVLDPNPLQLDYDDDAIGDLCDDFDFTADRFEDNETRTTAAVLTPGVHDKLSIHSDPDSDWFSIEVDSPHIVVIEWEPAMSKMRSSAYRSDYPNNLLRHYIEEPGRKTALLPDAGTYPLWIYGVTYNEVPAVFSYRVTVIEAPDGDGDGVPDMGDNCVDVPNPDQIDSDADGLGDDCDPESACQADAFEPNNSTADAVALAPGVYPNLTSCVHDRDYFIVDGPAGTIARVEHDRSQGEIGIDLYELDGTYRGESNWGSDTIEIALPEDGPFVIRIVTNLLPAINDYTLSIITP